MSSNRIFVSMLLSVVWLSSNSNEVMVHAARSEGVINLGEFLRVNDASPNTAQNNTNVLQELLNSASAHGKYFIFPPVGTYYLNRGIHVIGLSNSVIEINGRLSFKFNANYEPTETSDRPTSCISFSDINNVTLTSNSTGLNRGVIDGGGPRWYGIPFIGYLQRKENRPYLLQVNRSKELLIERLSFQEAPFYTLKLSNVDGVEIRELSIVNRRTLSNFHTLLDLSAFNTDGIDIDGHNVWIHDVDIWNQDDCIAVKDNDDYFSSNMTFERIHASGLGLVIGSIGETTVRNITFRDSILYRTVKGIYMKFRVSEGDPNIGGVIEDILFENITIESPTQWPIWVGPAQQAGGKSNSICSASPCSLCYPLIPFTQCAPVEKSIFRNIILRDVIISNPLGSPGVFIGSKSYSIESILLHNVIVRQGDPLVQASDIFDLFPGLVLNIQDDQYAIDGKNYFYLMCFGCLCLFICYYFFCKHVRKSAKGNCQTETENLINSPNRSRTWSEEKKRITVTPPKNKPGEHTRKWFTISVQTLYFLVLIFVLYALTHYLIVTQRVHNLSEYYLCDGVLNGIASGSTWPIPSCFSDHTTSTAAYSSIMNIEATKESCLIGGIMFALVFIYSISCLCSRGCWYRNVLNRKSYTQLKFITRSPSMQCIQEHEEFGDFEFP